MFKKINTQEILPDAKVGDQENIVKLAPPGRNDRIECWKVRDDLFKCLDKVDIKEEPNACQEYKNLLFNACPNSWAQHFIDKHLMDRKIKKWIKDNDAQKL